MSASENDNELTICWQSMDRAPRDRLIRVLVPTEEGGFIEGRAYWDDQAYDGSWWWEGTAAEDYVNGPIDDVNHGNPVAWRREQGLDRNEKASRVGIPTKAVLE